MNVSKKIFLCHASEDKGTVRDVYAKLNALGFQVWFDEANILPGQDWDYEIKRAIRTSALILVFLSRISVAKRGYVQKEFKLAMEILNEIPDGQVFVIPVKLDACEVPDIIRRLQWVNYYERQGHDRLFQTIARQLTPEHERDIANALTQPVPEMLDSLSDKAQMRCSSDVCIKGSPILNVPKAVFDDTGLAKRQFRPHDFGDFFVSPGGYVYCSPDCFRNYTED